MALLCYVYFTAIYVNISLQCSKMSGATANHCESIILQEQFEQDYTAVQRLAMITNYRSTSSIVAHSNALIACNYQHPGRGTCVPKALQAARGTKDNRAVQFVRYSSKEAQGQHILDCVKSWHEYGRDWPHGLECVIDVLL